MIRSVLITFAVSLALAEAGFCQLNSAVDPVTENGLLGAGWAFNRVLTDAGYKAIGNDPRSTLSIYQDLASGANGARQLSAPLAAGVTIVISPTNENGPGNVGFFYGGAVYSNSGRTGLFGTNFTLQDWLNRFGDKHGVYYFALPDPSHVQSAKNAKIPLFCILRAIQTKEQRDRKVSTDESS
jgi:hypothetical protein